MTAVTSDSGPDPFSCPELEEAARWAAFDTIGGDVNRPDEAIRDHRFPDAGVLVVSGEHGGGRLTLIFTAVPATGAIVFRSDAGCTPSQGAFFYLPSGAGDAGGGEWATAQLTVADGGLESDGGHRTSLLLTDLTTAAWLRGPLPKRSFELVLP